MHSLEDIEKSQKLYAEAKVYFMNLNLPDCVIEILHAPMCEWPIHLTPTERDTRLKIPELSSRMKPYISIFNDTGGVSFFYMDYITKGEELMPAGIMISSEIVDLDDYKPVDINEAFKELMGLIKSVQG